MILSTHAVFGAAVASLVPTHPVGAFALGFASHFVLDAIPHRDYDLLSIDSNKDIKEISLNIKESFAKNCKLFRDITFVSIDTIAGFAISYIFFFNPIYPWIFFIGAFASLIPDGLTFLSLIYNNYFLNIFYNLHIKTIHTNYIPKISQLTGVLLQYSIIGIIIAVIFGAKFLYFIPV